jgi:hypothetical protein
MNIEYKIIYRIGADIPINPAWIGDKLHASVAALQEEINQKNLHGTHTLELCYPEGWEKSCKPQAPSTVDNGSGIL